MGRHEVVSSPLRSPAVVLGVPVATVLATWSTTALLGGVVPGAEEAPLRAEEPSSGAPVPAIVPAAPAPASGLLAGVAGPEAADLADRVLPAPDGPRTTALRVIRLADEAPSPAGTTAERSDAGEGVPVVPLTESRPAAQDGTGSDGGGDTVGDAGSDTLGDAASAVPAAATGTTTDVAFEPERDAASSASAASSSPDAPTELGATARSFPVAEEERAAEGDPERGNAVLDLDTPSGGLSVLSFG